VASAATANNAFIGVNIALVPDSSSFRQVLVIVWIHVVLGLLGEIRAQDDRGRHFVDDARLPSPGPTLLRCVLQETLGLSRRPAFVEGVDGNSRRSTQIGGKLNRLLRFRATAAVHMDRQTDHGSTDLLLLDQRAKCADVALASAAAEYARWKCELSLFVGDRETDSFAAEVEAEYAHEFQCSDSRALSFPRLGMIRRYAYHAPMKIYTTASLEDPRDARESFRRLEEIGYDGAFSFEAKHDPFLPLVAAAQTTRELRLGTAVAIAFARNPMNLANLAYGLQSISEGRFVLGLGSQIRPHIQNRFSMPWSNPAKRMREIVLAVKAIFARWEGLAELDFRGEFYRHTLMIPAFDPGPNPYGPPPVYIGGFGPLMIEVAGEIADGFFGHPFNTRKSLETKVMPAIERGLARSGRNRSDLDLIFATMVVTADTEQEYERSKLAARKHLAFYGSTPAYRPTLDCHGWGDLHLELNRMSKANRWDEMTELIDEEVLETIAVVGPRKEIAGKLRARLAGIADGVSLTHNRAPDPEQWADVVADLKGGGG
jgi:probable F420-dependent oxidoreductase